MSNGVPSLQQISDMDGNFKYVLLATLNNKFTAIGGVVAIILSFMSNYLNGSINLQYNNQLMPIPVGIILSVLFLFLITFISIFSIAFKLHSNCVASGTPSVVRVYNSKPFSQNPNAKAVFILEPSNRFYYDILVSIYYNYPDMESNIGFGVVQNVQEENKAIQIEVVCILPGHESILNNLLNNNIDALKSLKVKPFVQRNNLIQSSEEVLKSVAIN